ncbi:MAG: hypothetical protein ACLF0G_04960 [Candidatus Brocadiia bacterium]
MADELSDRFPRYNEFEPRVAVRCITPDEGRVLHRFFDTSPISPSGRYAALTRLPFEDRVPQPGDVAEVVLVDLQTGEERVVADTRGWDTQLGAQVQWGGDDSQLFFNDLEGKSWRPFAVRLDPRTGRRKALEGTVYMVSLDGRWAASPCLKRTGLTQAGYGVVVPEGQVPRNRGAARDDGVYVTDTATGQRRLLLSFADIVERVGAPLDGQDYADGAFYGFHVKWNLQGTRLMLVLRWVPTGGGRVRPNVVTMKADGSDVHLAIPAEQWMKGGHHPNWCPDGEHVMMNLKLDGETLRLVQARYDGADLRPMTDAVRGSGHPSLHPDGRHVVTDSYPGEPVAFGDGTVPIRLIDVQEGTETTLVRIQSVPPFPRAEERPPRGPPSRVGPALPPRGLQRLPRRHPTGLRGRPAHRAGLNPGRPQELGRNTHATTKGESPVHRRLHPAGLALVIALVAGTARPATTLGIEDTAFTLDGRPTFLLGISYYGGLGAPKGFIQRDLDDLARRGFRWLRLWATWGAHGADVSAVDAEGRAREPYLSKLIWLVAEADRRGLVVDVTFSRGNGAVAAKPPLASHQAHLRAVATVAEALRGCPNVYIDLGNERNIRDGRHVPFDQVRQLRDRVKAVDPQRLVTASHAGDLSRRDVERYVVDCQLDFLAPHRPRRASSPRQTAPRTRQLLAWMRELGRSVPVHYQEPFRRDFSPWQPTALDFLVDARQARQGGAAGWCLHNGSPRRDTEGPRRSFDLREPRGRLFDQLDPHERRVADQAAPLVHATTDTWLALLHGRWYINGQITYPGASAEGLLMNVRMVNAVFEDRNPETCPEGFDPEANTDAFVARVPDYVRHGIRAFTLSLQGGMPGYEGALNSAFRPDGSLRAAYLERVERAIRAADRAGAAVILTCFYQRQDQVLRDAEAVRAAVAHAARWVRERGLANVVLEIANEYPHGGFDHELLRSPQGIAELIALARQAAPGLLVSASGLGNGRCDREVCEAADLVLIHFNGTSVADIPARVEALRGTGKAIVCNEDDKTAERGARAAEAAVAAGCSWGLMLKRANQYVPFQFRGHRDAPRIYATLRALTSAGEKP